ncbi:sigma-70 family RNA polymerase sigma factor [Iocasia frigidifontis]|uniref:Sigma-70 family RNA polymerase sigma factor n=1 Tax=Iocasia fonsfrigidae TaxID=2682810 RepID=A0A8A7KB41_9FIRM|nr:RNA polymerase sigma factor [Iocasia fonsfrigidae]QTL99006.1 sigma-70 family RNA polymerase sigma factor [Iocasia fonsfrigidae]
MAENIFSNNYSNDTNDKILVELAKQGKLEALEELVLKHQSWIYNISLRMTGSIHDAEDTTQEILIKILTRLSTFNGKSSFRTWLYRIVANHVFNMNRKKQEYLFSSFEEHRNLLKHSPDMRLDDSYIRNIEQKVLVEETKVRCLMGMILCLDRKQRLVFILGSVFSTSSKIGGEIMEISPENFRKILSRARKQLRSYIDERCSLLNKHGSCKCIRKTQAAIEAGYVNPDNLQFETGYIKIVKDFASQHSSKVDDTLSMSFHLLFKEQPFWDSPDYIRLLNEKIKTIETAWGGLKSK